MGPQGMQEGCLLQHCIGLGSPPGWRAGWQSWWEWYCCLIGFVNFCFCCELILCNGWSKSLKLVTVAAVGNNCIGQRRTLNFKTVELTKCHEEKNLCTGLGIGPLIGHVELVPKLWVLSEKAVVESLTKRLNFEAFWGFWISNCSLGLQIEMFSKIPETSCNFGDDNTEHDRIIPFCGFPVEGRTPSKLI